MLAKKLVEQKNEIVHPLFSPDPLARWLGLNLPGAELLQGAFVIREVGQRIELSVIDDAKRRDKAFDFISYALPILPTGRRVIQRFWQLRDRKQLTFTNVSDKPIQLAMGGSHWLPQLVLPETPGIRKGPPAEVKGGKYSAPRGYPVVEPGESLTWSAIAFPGSVELGNSAMARYVIDKSGTYPIKFTYKIEADGLTHPMDGGSWTGTITSNELTLKVLPQGGN